MATKDRYLSSQNGQQQNQGLLQDNSQYNNLNLNQNQNFSTAEKKQESGHKGRVQQVAYEKVHNNYLPNPSSNWKSNDNNEYSRLRNLGHVSGKKESGNTVTSSTLSLHIAAYENSNESVAPSGDKKMKQSNQQISPFSSSSKPQDFFNLPRQQPQEESSSTTTTMANIEVMKFKSSERLLDPDKQKVVLNILESNQQTMFNTTLGFNEYLSRLLKDNIYFWTSTPVTYDQMCHQHALLGQSHNLETTLKILGYHSINDFFLQNKEFFAEFLKVFVKEKAAVKDGKKNGNNGNTREEKPELILHYFNKNFSQSPALLDTWKDKFDKESYKIGKNLWAMTLEETKYFDFHNSLDFIDGRLCFVQLVQFCQDELKPNDYIPLQTLQEACQHMYGESWSVLLKKWFPNCSSLQNILSNIISGEIETQYADPVKKIQHKFKLRYPVNEIKLKLESFKNEATIFFQKIYRQKLYIKAEKPKPELKYKMIKSAPKTETRILQEQAGFYSDDEPDPRCENQRYIPRHDEQFFGNKNLQEKAAEGNRIKEYEELAKKYALYPDAEMEEFVPSKKVTVEVAVVSEEVDVVLEEPQQQPLLEIGKLLDESNMSDEEFPSRNRFRRILKRSKRFLNLL